MPDCVTLEGYCETVEADIVVDPTWPWSDDAYVGPDDFDIRSNVLHELGHVVGLGHPGDANAVMSGQLKKSCQKHTLRIDDLQGLWALYGPGGDPPLGGIEDRACDLLDLPQRASAAGLSADP
jgi:hypothetical protein